MSDQSIDSARFDVIKLARATLVQRILDEKKHIETVRKGKLFSTASDKTIADYRKETKAIFESTMPWERAANTNKKLTWLKRKSAVLYMAKKELIDLLARQALLQRTGGHKFGNQDFNEWCDTVDRLKFFRDVLETVPKDSPIKEPKKRESKRALGRGMPANWRELLSKRFITWKPQFLVLSVTGCRPVEIARGIKLSIEEKSGKSYLIAVISGAKIGEFAGQKTRILAYATEDAAPLIAELAQMTSEAGGEMVIDYSLHKNPIPEKAFSNAIKSAAKKEFPWLTKSITCYSLRHAAASDMKSSDLSSLEISAALGHQVEATKSLYGTARQGRGKTSMAPGKVKATTAVRPLKVPKKDFQRAPATLGK
jgi:integrase